MKKLGFYIEDDVAFRSKSDEKKKKKKSQKEFLTEKRRKKRTKKTEIEKKRKFVGRIEFRENNSSSKNFVSNDNLWKKRSFFDIDRIIHCIP